jgi:hypothetical protein
MESAVSIDAKLLLKNVDLDDAIQCIIRCNKKHKCILDFYFF